MYGVFYIYSAESLCRPALAKAMVRLHQNDKNKSALSVIQAVFDKIQTRFNAVNINVMS